MSQVLDRLTSSLVGRYTIERELGHGGMGTVYLAWDVKHRRKVAVKVLNADIAVAIGRERFLREIDIAARLTHPHVLPLHDSGEADGTLYYVMPYVEGESLREKLDREKQLSIEESLNIACEVADALAYAHSSGIVHRDIKPANIMLASNHAVVADFGVALLARDVPSERLTDSGQSLGTPLYMSPEQALGDRGVDARSDIYSLGCVLYEMLAGEPPFTARSAQAIVAKKLFEPVPRIRVLRETVTESLERVLFKALARNTADRFQTGAELMHALETATREQQRGNRGEGVRVDAEGDLGWEPEAPAARGVSAWRFFGIAAASLVMLTLVGFVTTVVYDAKMHLPLEYTPSRWDFPVLGARALIPVLVCSVPVLAVFLVLKYAARLAGLGFRRVSQVTPAIEPLKQRWSDTWDHQSKTANPGTVAELYFLGSIVLSMIVIGIFGRFLPAIWGPETDILSCAARSVHENYTWAMTVLIIGLSLARRSLLPYLSKRSASAGSIALTRWGGLAWILLLLLITTAPWRLLWNNERPRVTLNGQSAYIVMERGADLVIYKPDQRVTEHYRAGEPAGLVRLNTSGYVFEGATRCD